MKCRSFFEIWYVFAYNMFCVAHSMFFVSHSMFSVTHNMSKRKTVPVYQLLGFSHGLIHFWNSYLTGSVTDKLHSRDALLRSFHGRLPGRILQHLTVPHEGSKVWGVGSRWRLQIQYRFHIKVERSQKKAPHKGFKWRSKVPDKVSSLGLKHFR